MLTITKIKSYFPEKQTNLLETLLVLVFLVANFKTVCLYDLKDKPTDLAHYKSLKPNSRYVKFIRFFKYHNLDFLLDIIFTIIHNYLKSLNLSNIYLIDRTTWEYGEKKINLLVLSILIGEVAFPVYWVDLEKKGNSGLLEMNSLILSVVKRYDLRDIILIGDREFVSKDLHKYLISRGINILFRLRKGMLKKLINKDNKNKYSSLLARADRCNYASTLVKIDGEWYCFVVVKNRNSKNGKDKYIYLLSNIQNPKIMISYYLLRWKIEILFKYVKTCGFNLEEVNFKDSKKIELMTGICFLAYIMTVDLALKHQIPDQRLKTNPINGISYYYISIFNQGITILNSFYSNTEVFISYAYDLFINNQETEYQLVKTRIYQSV
jgi:hypothetical protein